MEFSRFTRMVPAYLLTMAVLALPGVAAGQRQASLAAANAAVRPTEVPDAPACVRCRIAARIVTRLSEEEGPGDLPDFPRSVVRFTDGRIVVPVVSEQPFVFDSLGAYLGRVGQIGTGPGEFRRARFAAVGPGDTLLVYDAPTGQVSVFDSRLRFIKRIPSARNVQQFEVLSDGTLLGVGMVRAADRIGLLYHLSSAASDSVRSIGLPALRVTPQMPFEAFRQVGRAAAGGFWSANEFYVYRLERWSPDGRLLQVLEPRSSWFHQYPVVRREGPGHVTPEVAPKAEIIAVWTDTLGRVWVAARTADPRWREGLGKPTVAEGGQQYSVKDSELIWDTVVEVIDPVRGRVLARATLPWVVHGAVGGNQLFSIVQRPDDGIRLDIWELHLFTH